MKRLHALLSPLAHVVALRSASCGPWLPYSGHSVVAWCVQFGDAAARCRVQPAAHCREQSGRRIRCVPSRSCLPAGRRDEDYWSGSADAAWTVLPIICRTLGTARQSTTYPQRVRDWPAVASTKSDFSPPVRNCPILKHADWWDSTSVRFKHDCIALTARFAYPLTVPRSRTHPLRVSRCAKHSSNHGN